MPYTGHSWGHMPQVTCGTTLKAIALNMEWFRLTVISTLWNLLLSPNPPKEWRYSSGKGDEWQRGRWFGQDSG